LLNAFNGIFAVIKGNYSGSLSTRAHATLTSRLTLIDEKVNIILKKLEEHGAALLLLTPRVVVLEEEERFRQKREDPPGRDASPER
jgi:hypothetical protein